MEYYWPHSYEYIEGMGQDKARAQAQVGALVLSRKMEGKAAFDSARKLDSKDLDWVSADRILASPSLPISTCIFIGEVSKLTPQRLDVTKVFWRDLKKRYLELA